MKQNIKKFHQKFSEKIVLDDPQIEYWNAFFSSKIAWKHRSNFWVCELLVFTISVKYDDAQAVGWEINGHD